MTFDHEFYWKYWIGITPFKPYCMHNTLLVASTLDAMRCPENADNKIRSYFLWVRCKMMHLVCVIYLPMHLGVVLWKLKEVFFSYWHSEFDACTSKDYHVFNLMSHLDVVRIYMHHSVKILRRCTWILQLGNSCLWWLI